MLQESAFGPKVNPENGPGEGASETAGEKAKPERLKSLEEDTRNTQNFKFLLRFVTQDQRGTDEEFRARLQGRVDSSGYLLSDRGQRVSDESGRNIYIGDKSPVPDDEQAKVLTEISGERRDTETELETARREARTLNSLVSLITRGETPRATFDAYVSRRIDSSGYLLNDRGQRVSDESGRNIYIGDTFKPPDREQAEVLSELFKEREVTVEERGNARAEARTLNSLVGLIARGETPPATFDAYVSNRVDSSGYLLDEKGRRIPDERGTGIYYGQNFELGPEQAALVREMFELAQGEKVPKEVRENMRAFLRKSDERAVERMREVLTVTEDPKLRESVERVCATYGTLQRRIRLKADGYKALEKPGSFEETVKLLGAYEETNTEDRVLVEQIRSRALALRRTEELQKVAPKLVGTQPRFDEAIADLNLLLKSSVPKDRAAALTVLKTLSRLELAKARFDIVRRVNVDADPLEIEKAISALPIRPTIGEFDYVKTQVGLREGVARKFVEIQKSRRLEKANEIRRSFSRTDSKAVLSEIASFPGDTEEDLSTQKQLLDLYRSYVAANKPEIFDEQFGKGIAEQMRTELRGRYVSPERKKNREGLAYMRERFLTVIYPLFESFRDDPRTKRVVEGFFEVEGKNGESKNARLRHIQRLAEIEKQRPLTDIERAYLESVELLSVFNPYMLAVATADEGVTREFLRHHFERLSASTVEGLKDGDYVPLIQVGLGPNGLVALGEIVRNNPELARQMLTIDAGAQPGGPFAIPGGPAWELNSANRRGAGGPTLPDQPEENEELKTVRAYGSPFRWYPGERSAQSRDVRQGSINVTVDYLPTPDDLSSVRYPTNEELQLILALQASVLASRVALKTRVAKVEPNPNPDEKGNKVVTLTMDTPGGERTLRLKTDALFVGTGLGEPTYGFKLEGSRAERVLKATKDGKDFPKISTTLEAFRALSDRTESKKSPGNTLVIWGKGNSADTLIEFIGSIFKGDNPRVRDVTKVYLVAEGDLSARPRYASISDLKPRNGRGNLIEQVRARVTDVDFGTQEADPQERKVAIYGPDRKVITDSEGVPILADAAIAATGFSPELDTIFKAYLTNESFRERDEARAPVQPITLPTSPDVAVADTLKKDPDIVFFGTASRPRFQESAPKLAQLPVESREALLRNGAENAVAIGFRAPDTQAAVNIWLNTREARLAPTPLTPREKVNVQGDFAPGLELPLGEGAPPAELRIANDVYDESLLLSPLIAYAIGNKLEAVAGEEDASRDFTGTLTFRLTYDEAARGFKLKFEESNTFPVSRKFLETVAAACNDDYFERYAQSALRKRRRDPKLEIVVAFNQGKMDPRNTVVQAG